MFITRKETIISIKFAYLYGLITNSDKFKPSADGTFFTEKHPLSIQIETDLFIDIIHSSSQLFDVGVIGKTIISASLAAYQKDGNSWWNATS